MNDIFDIILGLVEDKAVKKPGGIEIGVNEERGSPIEYDRISNVVIFSSLTLHISNAESFTIQ